MNFILKISGALCSAISYPFASRMLGAEGMGKVAFAVSVTGFFSMIATQGIPTYGIRECARVKDDTALLTKSVHELFVIQCLLAGLSTVLFALSVLLVPRFCEEWRLFLIQGVALMINMIGIEWMFAGLEQYSYLTISSVGAKMISVLLIILMIHSPDDYLLYAGLLILAGALTSVLNIIVSRRFVGWRPNPSVYELKKHFKPIAIFFAQTAAITIYTSLDSAMLGFISGDYWAGIYDSAIKVKLLLSYFVTSLGTVLLPRLSHYAYTEQKSKFNRNIRNALEFTLVTALPLSVFFLIMAPECVSVLFGQQFLPAAGILQVLMPTIVLIGLSTITGTLILMPTGREHLAMYSYISGAVVDFVLNLLLIPRFNALGAALGTLAAEITVFAIQAFFLRDILPGLILKTHVRSIVVAVIFPGLILFFFRQLAVIPELLRVLMGVTIYFAAVFGFLVHVGEPLAESFYQQLKRFCRRILSER